MVETKRIGSEERKVALALPNPLGSILDRPFGHWNLQYVRDRIRRLLFEYKNPGVPWLASPAVSMLEDLLEEQDRVLEWGSGDSTIWFAERSREVVSIEHKPEWYENVLERCRSEHVGNVRILLRRIERPHDTHDPEHPYVQAPVKCSQGAFDLILVDGRLREYCARAAPDWLKPGGILIIDDAERYFPSASRAPAALSPETEPRNEIWEEVEQRLADWRSIWVGDGVTNTAFYFKPC